MPDRNALMRARDAALSGLRRVCGYVVASSAIVAVACFIVAAWAETILERKA